jgi:cis-3-alkyl-4-acyloxetan-2-one decarboxylase
MSATLQAVNPAPTGTAAEILRVPLSGGGEVEVHVEGRGPDTVVMVHGFPDTYRLWDQTVAALKDRYRCARFTLPGFVNPAVRRGYPMDELMEMMERIVESVTPDRKVILLVHDWGCMVGYQYYARNPDRVAKVVGVDIGDPRSLRREIPRKAMVMLLAYQFTLAFAWKVGGRIGDAITRWMALSFMRCPSDPAPISSAMDWPYYMAWFGGWRGHVKAFEPSCPMLFIYAKRKPFMFHAPSWVEQLKARPGNEVHGFDTGHWVMLQDPANFNALIGRWLASA